MSVLENSGGAELLGRGGQSAARQEYLQPPAKEHITRYYGMACGVHRQAEVLIISCQAG
jgi:hypothetical protein